MASRKLTKKPRPPLKGPCGLLQGTNPKECDPHGEPTPEGDPVYCLDCGKPINGIYHHCFRAATSYEIAEVTAREIAEATGKRPQPPLPFAQRRFGLKQLEH